jgi:hypothetical protein
MKRNSALVILCFASHLGATKASGAGNTDSFGSHSHGRGHRLFQRPAERNPLLQLPGNALCHQMGIQFWALNLLNIDIDLLSGQMLKLLLEALNLDPLSANDDSRPGGMDVDGDPLRGSFYFNFCHPSPLQTILDVASYG